MNTLMPPYGKRNGVVYDEDTIDIQDGRNDFTIHAQNGKATFLEMKFYDPYGNLFIPCNFECLSRLRPIKTQGTGIFAITPYGSIRIIVRKDAVLNDSNIANPPYDGAFVFQTSYGWWNIDTRRLVTIHCFFADDE